MSFPKAEVKRFNDYSGCAPPVGAYDPKDGTKATGGVIEKTERFKHPKDVGDKLRLDSTLSLSNPNLCSTPIKGSNRLSNSSSSSESLVQNTSKRSSVKKPAQAGEPLARIKDLELEIRRLLREKNDKDKELKRLHQEQDRLEGRLNIANAERSSCLARSASLEQEVRDAKRGLDVLQKQMTSAETCGRKKEDKLKEEVRSLQDQIQSKEREIQSTQKQIVQALLALATDAEQCAKHSDGLSHLFCKLELNADMTESEDEEKAITSVPDSGFKQIDSQIRRVRRCIRRVSCHISKLEESGVEKLDGLQRRLEEEHSRRLQQVSSQLSDTRLQHQQLQNQLSQQQEQHEQSLAASQQQQQEDYDHMQLQIRQSQQDCEQARQRLEQSIEEYNAVQLRLQQSQEEHQTIQHQMQRDRDALESRLTQEQEALELKLKEEQKELEQKLKEEHAALESKLQESRELRMKEVGELQETCQQTQEKLEMLCEEVRQKEARLDELQNSLLLKQVEHEAASLVLQEELEQLQQKLTLAERDLLHKQGQHEEALLQLQRLQQSERSLQQELQESQAFRCQMQQQVDHLQQGELQLKGLVDDLRKNRDNLELEKEAATKELEIKGNLLNEALQNLKGEAFTTRETGTPTKTKQVLFEEMAEKASLEERIQELEEENKTLDSSIRSITVKYQSSIQDLELALEEERKRSGQMSARFSASEGERQKLSDELNQTQLVNRDLVQSLSVFKDEVCSLKAGSSDLKKQLEEQRIANTDLQAAMEVVKEELQEEKATNTNLQAAIKNLQLRVEEEQQTADTTCRELRMRVEQLEVENKQHQIANDALRDKLNDSTELHSKEMAQLKDKCQSLSQEKQRLGEKHKEDLQSVRKALALDRQANDLQMEELNLKLDRAQAFNNQLKEELKKLLKDNEKVKDDSRAEVGALQVQVETIKAKMIEATNESDLLRHQAKHAQADWLKLKTTVGELEAKLSSKEQELGTQQDNLRELQAEKEALEEHFNRLSGEHSVLETDMEKQLHAVQAAALEERTEYERMINEMSEKIQQLEEERELSTDTDGWQQKYEELFARVEPFLEQLDAFAAERNLLVGRSEMAEAEMAKMMDKYAKLLGHQNQKQKIQYISKLKDEYMQCRKEKEALKEKSNRMQNTIQKLEKKIQTLEGRKTFDPMQAFKHGAKKEDLPKTTPSRQGELAQNVKPAVRQDDVVRSPLKQSNK